MFKSTSPPNYVAHGHTSPSTKELHGLLDFALKIHTTSLGHWYELVLANPIGPWRLTIYVWLVHWALEYLEGVTASPDRFPIQRNSWILNITVFYKYLTRIFSPYTFKTLFALTGVAITRWPSPLPTASRSPTPQVIKLKARSKLNLPKKSEVEQWKVICQPSNCS